MGKPWEMEIIFPFPTGKWEVAPLSFPLGNGKKNTSFHFLGNINIDPPVNVYRFHKRFEVPICKSLKIDPKNILSFLTKEDRVSASSIGLNSFWGCKSEFERSGSS